MKKKEKKKRERPGLSRVYPGRLGSGSTRLVDRVFPGQLPGGFLLRPGPVPGPGRPGPESTRRAGPGFKTVVKTRAKLSQLPTTSRLSVTIQER